MLRRTGSLLVGVLLLLALAAPSAIARVPGGDPPPSGSDIQCPAGKYSASGYYASGHPEQCSPIPASFTSSGCWTLTVPTGADSVDVVAIGTAGATHGGLGDQMAGHAVGLLDGNQLRVCVAQGGGTGGAGNLSSGGDGGGASGVSTGSTFAYPFVVAGAGGGGTNGSFGGDAGMPVGQPGVNGGGGGNNTTSSGGDAGQALYPGVNTGTAGAGFNVIGPGRGGNGGLGNADGAAGGGAGGGGGYFGGGGGGNGDYNSGGGTGGGGGTSYCGDDHVDLTISDCVRTAQVGTSTNAGSAAGEGKVTLTFHSLDACPPGTYSANGLDSPVPCQTIPAAFTTAGCWTLTVPDGKNLVHAHVIGGAGGQGYGGQGGLGDEVETTAAGLTDGDQLRVCVNQGGGDARGNMYFRGGGASGVSFGADFTKPFVVAGGGGARSAGAGGDAGMPTGQTGGGSGPGTGGDNTAGQGGSGGVSNGFTNGGDGAAFDAAGPGAGGSGGAGSCCGSYDGGAGGAGYYGGGGAGGGSDGTAGTSLPGGGGGGTSYCGADNVSLTVAACVRTGGVGTGTEAGAGAGQPKAVLTFSSGTVCDLGTYSPNGLERPDSCAPADAGHYVDTKGATTQSECLAGYYQPNAGASSCLAADIGYYVDQTGSANETACPTGQTTASTGSDSASDCFDAGGGSDVNAPNMGSVSTYLRDGGHVGSATITVAWSATDDVSDASALTYEVERRRLSAGVWGPWGPAQTVAGAQSIYEIPLWRTQQFRVRAKDEAGNWSDWAESNTIYPLRRDDRHFYLTGTWQHLSLPGTMRGHVVRSSQTNATATLNFKGDGVALVMTTGVDQGDISVCIDPGKPDEDCQNVQLSVLAPGKRQFVATFTGLTDGKHTLVVQVTAGSVDVDGAIVSR